MSRNNNGNEACLLLKLPKELLDAVTSQLANIDIKRLRGVNRAARDIVPLRLQRVFLSANPLNIEVFRAIADHEGFRKNVTEIVWDDARLVDADYKVGQGLIHRGDRPSEDCPETRMWGTAQCREATPKAPIHGPVSSSPGPGGSVAL